MSKVKLWYVFEFFWVVITPKMPDWLAGGDTCSICPASLRVTAKRLKNFLKHNLTLLKNHHPEKRPKLSPILSKVYLSATTIKRCIAWRGYPGFALDEKFPKALLLLT